jgi:hypothetical protein
VGNTLFKSPHDRFLINGSWQELSQKLQFTCIVNAFIDRRLKLMENLELLAGNEA